MDVASSGVTTTGEGVAAAVPDVAVVELGVEATAPGVQGALDRANLALGAARAALLAEDVEAADMRTTQASTWPDEEHRRRTTARLTLRVTIRDISRSGGAIRRALDAAGDVAWLGSLDFAVGDPAPLAVAAREAAFEDARAKAEQFAALAGRRLGEVVAISEASSGPVRAMFAARGGGARGEALVTEPGTEDVRASVTVRWELAD